MAFSFAGIYLFKLKQSFPTTQYKYKRFLSNFQFFLKVVNFINLKGLTFTQKAA